MVDRNQLIVNHSSGVPERIAVGVDVNDPVLVSRARFDRLVSAAQELAEITERLGINTLMSHPIEPSDLDPIP